MHGTTNIKPKECVDGLEDYLRLCLLLNSSLWVKFFLFRLKIFEGKAVHALHNVPSHPNAKVLKSGGNKNAFVPLNVTLYLKPWTKLSLTE